MGKLGASKPGARVPRSSRSRRAARVTRAFLFSDLRDYTTFADKHGDLAAARLIRDYRALVRNEVGRHAGSEIKTEGDSFYVVFETTTSALECAVAIMRRATARTESGVASALRIAIGAHVGEAVPHDGQYVGVAVNVAARLVAKAAADEIVVSDALRGLIPTSQRYAMKDKGALKLKGVSEHVRAWSVIWEESPGQHVSAPESPNQLPVSRLPPRQILCPALVGRASELADFSKRLSHVATEQGQVVLLGGEAGVGKTAFVRRAQALANEAGFRVLVGHCDDLGVGLPYAPFLSAVRSAFRGLPRERLSRTINDVAPALTRLFPELEDVTVDVTSSNLERHRLALAFEDLFRSFAREPSVLLVLEDLHWADEASLDLLRFLARQLRDARVLVLGTYRTDDVHRRHPLARTLADLDRQRLTSRVTLRRLSDDENGEMIRLTLGGDDATSADLEAAVYRRSEGNPFFTEELLKSLVESGDVVVKDGRWTRGTTAVEEMRIPDSIVDAVRVRIDRLSRQTRATLDAASVIGLEFAADLLQTVRGSESAMLEAHVRELAEHQLVAERLRGRQAYAFRHALTREVVYDALLPSQRAQLHRRAADALMTLPLTEPALIAHHFIAAGAFPEAVPHLRTAAARAFRAGAPREAAAHYKRALEIGVNDVEVPHVLEQLADAYQHFDVALSARAAEECEARYLAQADQHGASRALLIASNAWQGYVDGPRATACARRAVEAVASVAPSIELARATAHLATLRTREGAWREGLALADQALVLAARFLDSRAMADALIAKGRAMRFTSTDEALELIRRGIDVAVRADLTDTALPGYTVAALLMGFLRRSREERVAFVDEGIAYARRQGAEEMAQLEYMRACLLAAMGDWDGALAIARQSKQTDRQYLLALQSVIVRGRDGPMAAIPLALEVADRGMRAHFAWDFIWAMPQAAVACRLAGDANAAREWLDRLRARFAVDEEARTQLRMGSAGIASALVAALVCDEPDWLAHVDAAIAGRTDPAVAIHQAESMAVATVLHGDVSETPRYLEVLFEPGGEEWGMVGSGGTWFTVICGREARRRGLRLDPNWAPVLERARAFSEKVRATWYLEELSQCMTG